MSVFILYFATLFTCFIYGSYRPEIKYIYLLFIKWHKVYLKDNKDIKKEIRDNYIMLKVLSLYFDFIYMYGL